MSELDFEAKLAAKLALADEPAGTTAVAEVTEATDSEEENIPAEVGMEEVSEEQPRDENGRFVSDRPEWLPPQFKTVDDYNRTFSEREKLMGRMGQELGDLRQMVTEIGEKPQSANIGQLGNALEENPEAVAYWAAEQGNEQVLDQAMAAWTQKALDEQDAVSLRNAQRFDRDIELAKLKYEFSQEVTPSIEQVRQEAGKRALALARRELQTQYPDFDQVMESVIEDDVAGLNPQMLGELQKTDPKAALEMVYRWVASGRKAPSSEADKEAEKAESLAAKRAATVATSSSSPAAREKSNIDLFKESILEPDAHSVHYGLTE